MPKMRRNNVSVTQRWKILGLAIALFIVGACAGESGSETTTTMAQATTTETMAQATTTEPAADPIVIRVGHALPTSEPIHGELIAVSERVSERTDGQLVLEVFPNAELGSNADMLEQAALGSALIAHIEPGYASASGGAKEMSILGGPFLFADYSEIATLVDSNLFAEWQEDLAAVGGLQSLAWNWYFGQRHIISNEGYPNPSDMEGVKIRIPPIKAWLETFEPLGAVPVTMEFGEVYTGLSQGVVDAAEAPLSTLQGASLFEVADTVTLTGHFKALTGWAMGTALWESLSEEHQKVLVEEFVAGGDTVSAITEQNELGLREVFENELEVTLVEPDVAAYAEAVKGFYDAFPEWREGLYEEVLSIIRG